METTNRKFEPIVNQGQGNFTPTQDCPHPLPPPGPCPHPHGQIFQGCIAYINSYIDVRMRQLYNKLKDLIHKIAGKYNGPWQHIVLEDANDSEKLYKVFVRDGALRTDNYPESLPEEISTEEAEERLAVVSANVETMREETDSLEGSVASVDAQITTLEGNVEALGGRLTSIRSNVLGLTTRLRGISTQVVNLERRVEAIELNGGNSSGNEPGIGIDDEARASISALSDRIANVEASCSTFGNSISQLGQSLTSLSNTVANLGIATLSSKVTTLSNSVANLTSTVNELKSQVRALESNGGSSSSSSSSTTPPSGDYVSLSAYRDLETTVRELASSVQTLSGEVAQLKAGGYKIRLVTQAAYDAMEEHDASTLYFISDEPNSQDD